MKGRIIDGVAGSGKTTILNNVHSRLNKVVPNATKLFISEHYTERILEHYKEGRELNGEQIKDHIAKIIQTLDIYQSMLNESKFKKDPGGAEVYVTLERFILTHFSSMQFLLRIKEKIIMQVLTN